MSINTQCFKTITSRKYYFNGYMRIFPRGSGVVVVEDDKISSA